MITAFEFVLRAALASIEADRLLSRGELENGRQAAWVAAQPECVDALARFGAVASRLHLRAREVLWTCRVCAALHTRGGTVPDGYLDLNGVPCGADDAVLVLFTCYCNASFSLPRREFL